MGVSVATSLRSVVAEGGGASQTGEGSILVGTVAVVEGEG